MRKPLFGFKAILKKIQKSTKKSNLETTTVFTSCRMPINKLAKPNSSPSRQSSLLLLVCLNRGDTYFTVSRRAPDKEAWPSSQIRGLMPYPLSFRYYLKVGFFRNCDVFVKSPKKIFQTTIIHELEIYISQH